MNRFIAIMFWLWVLLCLDAIIYWEHSFIFRAAFAIIKYLEI
jgi:hypothetical protein